MPKNSYLKLYIGIPDPDDVDEYLYLDLVVPGREKTLWSSPDKLNDSSGDDILQLLEEVINEAIIYSKALNLQISIDAETLEELVEDFTERHVKEFHQLIKEIRKE